MILRRKNIIITYTKIIEIWKKVNSGTSNKLGIIRDYDYQDNAKKDHDKYDDGKLFALEQQTKKLSNRKL